MQEVINRACVNLGVTVKDLGVNLTFDISDLGDLEEVLLGVSETGDDSAISGACFMAGAYVGEILRRAGGGEWTMSTDGVATLQLGRTGDKIFPMEKVRKFVQNPAGESLVFYTQALMARNRTGA